MGMVHAKVLMATALVGLSCYPEPTGGANDSLDAGGNPADHANAAGSTGDDGSLPGQESDEAGPTEGSDPCDVWVQNCPPGEKCVATGTVHEPWSETQCVPIAHDARQIGEPCEVFGLWGSGVDNCDQGSMCFYLDRETNEGICTPVCQGSPDAPRCPAGTTCMVGNRVLAVCMDECDPLRRNCPDEQSCIYNAMGGDFNCVSNNLKGLGSLGDACDFVLDCDPGLFCFDGTELPGCDDGRCCTEFCDLLNPRCSQPGVACRPFRDGHLRPEHTDVGICRLPNG